MKRDALAALWDKRQKDLRKAQVLIEVRGKRVRRAESECGDSLLDLHKDSLEKLWKTHQQVQQTLAWRKS
eukprot:scaffold5540_cov181-Amphora_coffeaeformis.AAC.2